MRPKKSRIETDTIGEVKVESTRYWGAQTERARLNFNISSEKMPKEIISALAIIKKAAANTNYELGILKKDHSKVICKVSDEIMEGLHSDHFPLNIWQTGSGTQTNMNVNEVISNRSNEILKQPLGAKKPIHPNDHVNASQSSNDVFPSAINIAATVEIHKKLLPALDILQKSLLKKSKEFKKIIKIGRTHLMDAVPLTLGDEFSGYAAQVMHGIKALEETLPSLYELALGGTAVGTGLNAPKGFKKRAIEYIAKFTNLPFKPVENNFEALACHDAIISCSGALKRIACALFKIASDIRLLASGPRAGIGELILPANEPGSSIMPGKVNPTQCEAVIMVAIQVMSNDMAITIGGANGQLELNVLKPLIAFNILQSIELLTDAALSFSNNCIEGIVPDIKRIQELLENSLMIATALAPIIGYDKTAKLVQKAYKEGKSLKIAANELGILTPKEFDKAIDFKKMV